MVVNASPRTLRNPGPRIGWRVLTYVERTFPPAIKRPLYAAGTTIAAFLMPEEWRFSRAYLQLVLPTRPTWRDVLRHFAAFQEFMMVRLRMAAGMRSACTLDQEHAAAFEALIASGRPALFGTFHFGHSDLLGFMLAARQRTVAMVRLRVGNSEELDWLEREFAGAVSFIWVNEPGQMLFALKAAIDEGRSVALQCDRPDFSAKTEYFDFLGAKRLFPFTMYHLAALFHQPVMFCFGVPEGGGTRVIATPLFEPDPRADRHANLARGRVHFQAVLGRLESLVRQHPFLWFNFRPLNPVEPAARADPA